MCGFTGIISKDVINYSAVYKMNDLIGHRGPDSAGIVGLCLANNNFVEVFPSCNYKINCVSSFRRLSIRDLSANANQPMLGEHSVISFVGEIYNLNELKEILEKRGEIIRSQSDTEVILKWYEIFGVESLLHTISGMYAIVIIDKLDKVAYLIRDRFGVKPLYYYYEKGILVYSSEIKSICNSEYYKAELNYEGLGEILLYRSPHLETLFKDINQVKPGEMLSFDLKNGGICKTTWFDINQYSRFMKNEISEAEAYGLLSNNLKYAVQSQMVSDVPIGIQLSGGIDSGVIANISRHNKPLKSFSIIGGDGYYSEEDRIRRVNSGNKELMRLYNFSVNDFWREYEKVIWHLEGISSHPNALGFYKLTQNAQKEVSVLLSGEGADELLAGYRQFMLGKTIHEAYDIYAVLADQDVDASLMKMLFPDFEFENCIHKRKELFSSFTGDNLDRHIKYELTTYLPDLLIKQDRMAMANSVENRVPFLDYQFVDVMMTIPNELLVKYANETKCYEGKYILKRFAADIFDEDYGFQKKRGFPMPLDEWMRHSSFMKYVFESIIPSMRKRGVVDVAAFEKCFNNLSRLTDKEIKVIWKVINFETWAQIFMDGRNIMSVT